MIRPSATRPGRSLLTLTATLLVAGVTVLTSCQTSQPHRQEPTTPRVSAIQEEPRVRVRIMKAVQQLTVAGPDVRLAVPNGPGQSFASPLTIGRDGASFIITDARGQAVRAGSPLLEVTAGGGGVVIDGTSYPGVVILHGDGSTLDAVNHVSIEDYLPGVLERELYSTWPVETFVAQAIAARSYAIAQLSTTGTRHYDLESTVASQVYGGRASNPRAIEAVQRTRGQVLTWDGRIVRAYFSASSGGVSQDAAAAFPDNRADHAVIPLRGRVHGWGRSSSNFQWGPIRREVTELAARLAAWGRAQRHPVANLSGLARIEVAERGSTGRPARFQLVDRRGQVFTLSAEQFRFACNAEAPGQPKLGASEQLKSSFLELRIDGGTVTFTGRGHGHGVGLDQWAARDMATQGYTGHQIVTFFYPGAQVQRVY